MASSTYASFTVLPEPFLEFGRPKRPDIDPVGCDPQIGLLECGPYSTQLGGRWHPSVTRVIPIACDTDFADVTETLGRLADFERIETACPSARVDFPGFEVAYRSKLEIVKDVEGQIMQRSLFDEALGHYRVAEGFKALIETVLKAVDACGNVAPGAVLAIYLPRDIVTQFRTLTPDFQLARPSKKKEDKNDSRQMILFSELTANDDEEESLYHDLRRAIKVRAMQRGVAIQLLTDSFLTDEPSQPWAGKFWNVSCSLFAKAGGIPWRLPTEENIAHCGIRFGVSKDSAGTKILVGVAQVFSASGELVAVRTGRASRRSKQTSEAGYFLTMEQAFDLISSAIDDYEMVTGRIPDRMLVHKSSQFKDEEVEGVAAACRGVREADLVYIKRNTPFRLMPPGGQPARRGTVVPTADDSALLYLSGFIESERSWRGKHIPSPVEIVRCQSNRSLLDLAEEVMRLTKMNWNTTIYASRHPCTFANASEMIGMMKELRNGEVLLPQIRYYI